MPEENKRKFALWIYPDTQERIKELYKKDNCKSQSEFIEKAVRFYCGYPKVHRLGSAGIQNPAGADRQD